MADCAGSNLLYTYFSFACLNSQAFSGTSALDGSVPMTVALQDFSVEFCVTMALHFALRCLVSL